MPIPLPTLMEPTVLIIGELSHLSERLIKQLWQKGYQPRWLVNKPSTAEQIQALFPQRVEICWGDWQDPEHWAGVTALLYCPAVTSQRELDALVQVVNQYLPQERELFDFTRVRPGLVEMWGAIDDVVMGGTSASSLSWAAGRALFAGHLSVENSGGFVSIRTRNFAAPIDLTDYEGISLRLRGNGQRYKLFLRPTDQWDGLAYAYSFDTNGLGISNLLLPFRNFRPVQRAKTVNNAPFLDPSRIAGLQIMLSKFEYDGSLNPYFRPGDFCLELFSIGAYGRPPCPQLIVVAPSTATEGRLQQPLAACQKPYTLLEMGIVVDRPGGQSLELSCAGQPIGSVSSADLAELCVRLLTMPAACYRTICLQEVGRQGVNDWSMLVAKAIQP
jgi:Complex I intermediate-associated protein 30 (CIA30)